MIHRRLDHSRAPLLDALADYHRQDRYGFTPPGHRQGRGADPRARDILGAETYRADLLASSGLDDRSSSHGFLSEAEELMADAVGAGQAFFSTAGSSLSVKSAMISVAGPGEKLLVSRNAHKSVVSALIIAGIVPVWVHPHFDDELHLAHPPEPADVRTALSAHPDAKGMLLITPTDWGTCADIAGVAEVCHSAGVPLIVDEAWGAHFPFHADLPTWGMDAGADVVVTSVHKMGAAVEQSSVFHLQGDRVDPTVLKAREDLLGTTSSSSLVYLTLDGWRRHMVEHGEELLTATLRRAERIRSAIGALDGLSLMGREVVRPGGAFDLDPFVFTVDVRGLGVTGYAATEWVRASCHVDLSAADTCRVSARVTHADGDDTEKVLIDAFEQLVEHADEIDRAPDVALPRPGDLELETVMRPRDAFFARVEQVPAEKAIGRIVAEMLSPYPPGVPVLAPGERITAAVVDYLRTGLAAGMLVPDAADPELTSFRVVAE
jgi:arginine decarboxylase